MSLTLGQPTRLVALVGALVLTGLAGAVFLLGRGALGGEPSAATASTPVHVAPKGSPSAAKRATPRQPVTPKPKPVPVASGLPPRIDRALKHNGVVVVSVSIPGAAVDTLVRREARAAARASRAGFVALSPLNERAVSALVAKTGVLPDPAVVVVRRPGVVAAIFSVTDAATIAQAVAQARG